MKTMNEQSIILIFLLVAAGITLFLYLWKAKKEIEYKKDERWQLLQNKANNAANSSNSILILLVAIGSVVSLFYDIQLTITFDRALIYVMIFIGLRNGIELFALRYLDKRM
jgi:cytochrome c biogenesis protein CcdA